MKYTHTTPFVFGMNPLVTAAAHPELMGLNFSVLRLAPQSEYTMAIQEETLALLLTGSVSFHWNGAQDPVKTERASIFHQSPAFLHADMNTEYRITCDGDEASELIVVSTKNPKSFAPRFFEPKDLASDEVVGEDILDGRTKRAKRVLFDRTTRPEANLFCGELITYPGSWANYPPHLHTEPEIYFYRFLPESGYGFSEQGEEVFKVKQNELVGIPDGLAHSQVTAPGYAGYIFWAQRMQEDGGDIQYRLIEEHAWTDDPNAEIYPLRRD